MKKATLKDVAKDSGFSVTITSRVLSNYGSFSEEARVAVMKSAEKLNYQPNVIARSLRSGNTKAIGVMVNSVLDSFWMTLFKGIEETALNAGYQVVLCNSDGGLPEKEQHSLKLLTERNIDGVILSPSIGTHNYLKKLSRSGLPIVLIDSSVGSMDLPSITVDNKSGAYSAVEYLVNLGHRRIGIVTGGDMGSTSAERLEGYLDALERFGIEIDQDLIKSGDFKDKMAFQAVNEFLDMKNPPSALFICNESMTAGALSSIKEHELKIPDDISIIGWDNPSWTEFMNPGLTTIDQASHTMGILACQALFSEIHGVLIDGADRNIKLKPNLVIRESCKALN